MAIPYTPSEKTDALFTVRATNNRGYPWLDWLDGHVWKLVQEEDFPESTPRKFVSAAHSAAKFRFIKVRTRTEGNIVWLQALVDPPTE